MGGVDLEVRRGTIHALIGPNGGQDDLVQLADQVPAADARRDPFKAQDITREKPAEIARNGLIRKVSKNRTIRMVVGLIAKWIKRPL